MHITVRVTPSAGKEHFQKVSEGVFEAYVREPPVNNMANRRVCALVAEHFRVGLGGVRIIVGHRARKKTISIQS
jgi:uncharacterized protein YggU (UPF0235/DUF167 family)